MMATRYDRPCSCCGELITGMDWWHAGVLFCDACRGRCPACPECLGCRRYTGCVCRDRRVAALLLEACESSADEMAEFDDYSRLGSEGGQR